MDQIITPPVYGDIVVWYDNRAGGGDWNIYGKNLKTGENLNIYTGTGNQEEPSIYGDIVVWQDK
jgi:beta propeller repeat protein